MKKILLTGIQPSGKVHIGNYFGTMKQMVDLQSDYDCLFMIADYHALNFIQNAEHMRDNILNLALDFIAIGIDPNKSTIFRQSDISAHTELAWVFDTITSMPYLMRAHAFKSAEAKNKEISVGKFNYPVLMASDILLYDTDIVPVGQDQKQHIEYTRDIAEKFNHTFSETFKLPEALIMKDVAIVPGIDGQKMSKSYGNTISLFAEREEIIKAVMSIVTDSGDPEDGGIPTNVYNIHKLLKSETEIREIYDRNKGKYKILKEALIEDLDSFMKPLREKREKISQDNKKIEAILAKGASKAGDRACKKLLTVKKNIGVL
ncbi:MAG TPA: tryptophan--tRNA ligase [Candidatus Paceibacterota bacterium]